MELLTSVAGKYKKAVNTSDSSTPIPLENRMRGKSPGDEVGDTYEQVLERGGGGVGSLIPNSRSFFNDAASRFWRIPHPASRIPSNGQIPYPVKKFCVFPNLPLHFGQISDAENSLPDPVRNVTCCKEETNQLFES